MKKEEGMSIVVSALFLILGIILFTNPGGVVQFIAYIVGGFFALLGVIYLFKYYRSFDRKANMDSLYSGIISVMIGIIVMFCAGAIELAIRLLLGSWILYRSIITMKHAIDLKNLQVVTWKRGLVIAILLFICGLYIVLRSNLVLSMIGLLLIIYAITEIVGVILSIVK